MYPGAVIAGTLTIRDGESGDHRVFSLTGMKIEPLSAIFTVYDTIFSATIRLEGDGFASKIQVLVPFTFVGSISH